MKVARRSRKDRAQSELMPPPGVVRSPPAATHLWRPSTESGFRLIVIWFLVPESLIEQPF